MEDYKNMFVSRDPGEQGNGSPVPDPVQMPEDTSQETAGETSAVPRQVRAPQEFPASQQSGAGNPDMSLQEEVPLPPGASAPPGGAFYGDPNAPTGVTPPPPPRFVMPSPPPVEHPAMNGRIYAVTAVATILIFLLCAYCIAADVMHGALGSGSYEPKTEVVIQTQEKPELDPADENVTADGEYTVKGVAEVVTPSIVEIYVYSSTDRKERDLSGTGSGIIITEDGYLITNAHVVQGACFTVITSDETEYDAELIGSDAKTDLAVLKIDADNLTAAVLGNSDEVYVGESVVAIGNPAGLTNTVTKGIVSAINRQVRSESNAFVMDCIQTDAAISPGNSGGALVNMYGQVIGITSSKYASGYGYSATYEGLGFAIAINQALPVVQDLITQGYVSGRYRIGITFLETGTEYAAQCFEELYGVEMPEELQGLWISEISEDCDISNTELQPYDFVLSMNGQRVGSYDDVIEVLEGFEGGDTVTAECARWEKDGSITRFTIEFKLETDTSGNY